mmetsp:Transcript_10954/g.17478  ORF Transcript_10954/g.17478 Transcript_10954/m.17478 type:complete len:235 (+) Transcript_10954:79-783(+)
MARRPGHLLLAGAAAWICVVVLPRDRFGSSFVEPSSAASSPQHLKSEGAQGSLRVSRADAVRWASVLAVGLGGAAPSTGAVGSLALLTGVTKPWGKRPDGGDDELHTGGVEWEDIKVGTGALAKIGDIVAINMRVSATIKEKEIVIEDTNGKSKDFRFGVGQMIPGMDEGIFGMRTGGVRKMRIPGNLAFGAKAIPATYKRDGVPQYAPVEAIVTLEFIPGADDVYRYGTDDAD